MIAKKKYYLCGVAEYIGCESNDDTQVRNVSEQVGGYWPRMNGVSGYVAEIGPFQPGRQLFHKQQIRQFGCSVNPAVLKCII